MTKSSRKSKPARENQTGLARVLNCSRTTVWTKLRVPGAPKADKDGRFDVAAVESWLVAHAPRAAGGPALAALRCQKLRLECECLQLELGRARSAQIPRTEAGTTLAALGEELAGSLTEIFVTRLPTEYPGKDGIACAVLNAAGRDEFARRFRSGRLASSGER